MSISTDQEFNRTSIAVFDFEKAIEFASAAQRYPANAVEYEGLLFAAIVSYVRPFSGNERSPGASAESRLGTSTVDALDDLERQLHDRCRDLRNRALAHSEVAMNATRFDHATGVARSRPFSLLSSPFDVQSFITLAETMKGRCQRDRAEYVLGRRRSSSDAAGQSEAGR